MKITLLRAYLTELPADGDAPPPTPDWVVRAGDDLYAAVDALLTVAPDKPWATLVSDTWETGTRHRVTLREYHRAAAVIDFVRSFNCVDYRGAR